MIINKQQLQQKAAQKALNTSGNNTNSASTGNTNVLISNNQINNQITSNSGTNKPAK